MAEEDGARETTSMNEMARATRRLPTEAMMVDARAIELWRQAPRLTSFAAFFERTASGKGGAPDLAKPQPDMSLLDFDLDCAVFSDIHPVVIGGSEASSSDALEQRLAPELVRGVDAERILHRFRDESARFGTEIKVSDGTGLLKF